jgi:ribosomal protein S18 acetylase RimI-like enzyme
MTDSIRTGSGLDIESCVDLWARVIAARDGSHVIAEVAQKARAAFEQPIVRFAAVGSPPHGFALTVARGHRVAHLSRICVDPSAASRGLGSALLADAIRHAHDSGFAWMSLDVRETNARAISLYARAGFVAVSEPWDYDGGDLMTTWSLALGPAELSRDARR